MRTTASVEQGGDGERSSAGVILAGSWAHEDLRGQIAKLEQQLLASRDEQSEAEKRATAAEEEVSFPKSKRELEGTSVRCTVDLQANSRDTARDTTRHCFLRAPPSLQAKTLRARVEELNSRLAASPASADGFPAEFSSAKAQEQVHRRVGFCQSHCMSCLLTADQTTRERLGSCKDRAKKSGNCSFILVSTHHLLSLP